MNTITNIQELLHKQPELLFANLPDRAEEELISFYSYLLYKYNIPNFRSPDEEKFATFIHSPIKIDSSIKFSREELHER